MQYLRSLCEEGVRQPLRRARGLGRRSGSGSSASWRPREAGLRQLLPHRLGFHPLGAGAGHPRRAGARLGGRLDGGVCHRASPTSTRSIYKLLFERFLNPERVSPPDIDVDFCQNRRGEVIDYVRQKYGERAVAQIATFGTMGAKSVVRDVGRVMGLSYGDADRIAKMIPNELNITLNGEDKKNKETGQMEHIPGAIDKNPELKKAVETEGGHRAALGVRQRARGLHAQHRRPRRGRGHQRPRPLRVRPALPGE